MGKYIFSCFFFLLSSIAVISQTSLAFVVSSCETGEPLPFTTVSYLGQSSGTLSNIQGSVFIRDINNIDSIEISFIGYSTIVLSVFDLTSIDHKICLEQSIDMLNEVTVYADEGYRIMKNVVDKLYENHSPQDVKYNLFYTSINDRNDHFISKEALINVHVHDAHNTAYNIENYRTNKITPSKVKSIPARLERLQGAYYRFDSALKLHSVGLRNGRTRYLKNKNYLKCDIEVLDKYNDDQLGMIAKLSVLGKGSSRADTLTISLHDHGIIEVLSSFGDIDSYKRIDGKYYISHIHGNHPNRGYDDCIVIGINQLDQNLLPINSNMEIGSEQLKNYDRSDDPEKWKPFADFKSPNPYINQPK